DQRIDQRMDGGGAAATVLAHDQRCLAGEGCIFHRPHALCQVAGERRLAGTGPAEEAEDLRAVLVLEPARDGHEGLVLLGRPLHHQTMLVLTVPTPAISPTSTSPRTTAPTPAGVPLKMRSPRLSSTQRERW